MMNASSGIKLEDSVFYNISMNRLLSIMEIENIDELKKLSSDDNYNVYIKGAKRRIVEAPNEKLKAVQKKFNKLLQKIETPEYVFAGRKKMNYVLNAKAHIGCNNMVCTDIKKFFPHTNIKYLLDFLENELKISSDTAFSIAALLTYKGHLPTGAPSSPLLTFWAYKSTFDKIYSFSKALGIKMTIYVDDMTFSSTSKVSCKLIPFVDKELSNVGLQLHPDKIKRFKCSKNKHVTGVCIDKKHNLRVKNAHRQKLITLLNSKEDIAQLSTKEIKACIGMISTMQLVEPSIFAPTLKKLKQIYKSRPKI